MFLTVPQWMWKQLLCGEFHKPGGGEEVCGLNRVYLEAGTWVFCYLIKNKERQLPNKPYVGFWVGKAGNFNNLNNLNNLNIGVDPGEGVGPGI